MAAMKAAAVTAATEAVVTVAEAVRQEATAAVSWAEKLAKAVTMEEAVARVAVVGVVGPAAVAMEGAGAVLQTLPSPRGRPQRSSSLSQCGRSRQSTSCRVPSRLCHR